MVPRQEFRNVRLLLLGLLQCLLLIRELPLPDRLALTAPLLGGASRVLLHLPGFVRGEEVRLREALSVGRIQVVCGSYQTW